MDGTATVEIGVDYRCNSCGKTGGIPPREAVCDECRESAASVAPKGIATSHGIVCPHCHKYTNHAYRWHPALNCWSCGEVMWRDDHGRTISERAAIGIDLDDTPADRDRIRLMQESMYPRDENTAPPRTRGDILDRAKALTCGVRDDSYGDPKADYRDVAAMASALLSHKLKEPITASEAALFMCLIKLRRAAHNPDHADSFDDGAAYFAIAGECAAASL